MIDICLCFDFDSAPYLAPVGPFRVLGLCTFGRLCLLNRFDPFAFLLDLLMDSGLSFCDLGIEIDAFLKRSRHGQ